MTPARALAVLLSISCAFLLGREFARRAEARAQPNATYDLHVEAARRAETTLADAALRQGASFIEVADKLRPSVVSIHGSSDTDMSSGTGLIVAGDGAVLTNYHVVRGLGRIQVTLSSSDRYDAVLVGQDEPTDLALLRIEGVSGLMPASFGDSDGLRVAEEVLAIGNAFGFGWTVTRGIVSSLHRSGDGLVEGHDLRRRRSLGGPDPYTDYIQTDAAINPGNSGGPIVNASGEVVGISTAILSRPSEGIGFAIPSNDARFVAEELMRRGRVLRGYLGIQGTDLSRLTNEDRRRIAPNATGGTVVTRVEPDTPAAVAGLAINDVILALDGRPLESFEMLRNRIARTPPNSEVTMRVIRGGQETEVRAVTAAFPD
jgi:S1-C subfamily serine protease